MLLMVTLYESEIAMLVQLLFTSKCNGEPIGLNVGLSFFKTTKTQSLRVCLVIVFSLYFLFSKTIFYF